MTLTEQQTKRANKLLDLLCEVGDLNGIEAYSLFDSKNDAVYVCSVLEKERLLSIFWVDGKIIDILSRNENTCNAVATNLLDKELIQQAKLDSKEQLETEILKLQKDSLDYQLTIREQQDRIRNLEEQNKFIELLKGYWWVLLICIGIGAGLLEFWDTIVP
jgi:hypothetical protein